MKLNITIVGFGNVGRQICSLLLQEREMSLLINILEVETNMSGALIDFQHAATATGRHEIIWNQQEEFARANFIFHCAGGNVPKGSERNVVVEESCAIVEAVYSKVNFIKDPVIIALANPVEIITWLIQKITKLPAKNVLGTGTYLDTQRFLYFEKQYFGKIVDPSILLLGEHGSSLFVSSYSIGGSKQLSIDKAHIQQLLDLTKNAASEIKKTEKATIYGVSQCALEVFRAFFSANTHIFPLSTSVPNKFLHDTDRTKMFLSIPVEINKNGCRDHFNYHPDNEELSKLKDSMEALIKFLPEKYIH